MYTRKLSIRETKPRIVGTCTTEGGKSSGPGYVTEVTNLALWRSSAVRCKITLKETTTSLANIHSPPSSY